MKRAILSLAALFLINIIPCPAFAVEQERPATAPTITQQREQYEKSMEERLGRLGQQLDELKAKAAGKTEQAREEMKQFLVEADAQRRRRSGFRFSWIAVVCIKSPLLTCLRMRETLRACAVVERGSCCS